MLQQEGPSRQGLRLPAPFRGSWFSATGGADVIVDDIAIFRQDVSSSARLPANWSKLNDLPYPRLGMNILGTTLSQAYAGGLAEGPPLRVSQDQIEAALAFFDVITGPDLSTQTLLPDSVRRLKQMNPNLVILPDHGPEEAQAWPAPPGSDINVEYQFFQGLANAWFLKTTEGSNVADPDYPGILKMNLSPYCPVVNGDTYITYLLKWLNNIVFPAGIWDGVFFDNLFGRINYHIFNANNPSLLDVDYQGSGVRSGTPAWVSEMTRTAATGFQPASMHSNKYPFTYGASASSGLSPALPTINCTPPVFFYNC
jgi:hypothetical protein